MRKRIFVLDLLRTYAILGMVIFHSIYLLNYFNNLGLRLYDGWSLIFVRSVQYIFLSLVGVSLSLSYSSKKNPKEFFSKQRKRGFFIFSLGILISLISYLIIPEKTIYFGVLHLIGFSILILHPVVKKPILSFGGFLLVLILTPIIKNLGDLGISKLLETPISSDNLFLFILGIKNTTRSSFDHFSIFPWISLIFLGISLGYLISKKTKLNKENKQTFFRKNITFISKQSLFIYLIHIPIILGIYKLLELI